MKVLKFGGSSVANAANIKKVAQIVANANRSEDCIVVLSAMQGTTDSLIETGRTAERGDETYASHLLEIKNRHKNTLRELYDDNPPADLVEFFEAEIAETESLSEGVRRIRELTPRTLDRILSFGELVSSRIVSALLRLQGVENVWLDSRSLIRTDSRHGFATVDVSETVNRVREAVNGSRLFILPGFIASDVSGNTTTLGRGGSDFSAAIAAAAVDAEILEIWTDVNGMMTADPRFVRNARLIPRINYREAMELSHFGAKVIYPPTIQPVMAKGIPVMIKNTFAPDDEGTLIVADASNGSETVRGITSIDHISVLNLEGSGMIGIPGFSKRLFDALSREQINVILITQSSSEHSICVAIEERYGQRAKDAVDREFENEIAVGKIDPLRVENGVSILALVGDNMREHTGISGKMFSTLGQNGINIRAIAQGSSERNISVMIDSKDVRKAVNTLHEEFFSEGRKQINLIIAGTGTVGSRLIEQIRDQAAYLSEETRLNVRVVGLLNSKKNLFEESGVDLNNWKTQLTESTKTYKGPAELADAIISKNLRNTIFIDITANEDIVEVYKPLLRKSISVVACNKIACSSQYSKYKELKGLAREYSAQFLFETNVGAGLPVINTLNDLIRSGDRIHRIEAVLSGTLNFVFNNYDGTRKFADVVRQAQTEGYTEPDPRLDLSGTDVARKILILARESGLAAEFEDVVNQPFLPAECLDGSIEDFYSRLESFENYFRELLEKAAAKGQSLKYIASMVDGNISVGLRSIGPEHDFAGLSGKDNAVLFYTSRYPEQPLVIKGAGAGADVTAAGVFADIIRAAR